MVFIHFLAIGRLLINVTSLSLGVCVWIVSWNHHSIFHNTNLHAGQQPVSSVLPGDLLLAL